MTLAAAFPQCPKLRKLKVGENRFGGEDSIKLFKSFAAQLSKCEKLEELNLYCNDIGNKGMGVLVQGLLECRSLHTLNVGFSEIEDEGVLALIPLLLRNRLSSLDISENPFGSKAIYGLAQALPDSALMTLRMRPDRYRINAAEAEAIANALRFNGSLVQLIMPMIIPKNNNTREIIDALLRRNEGFRIHRLNLKPPSREKSKFLSDLDVALKVPGLKASSVPHTQITDFLGLEGGGKDDSFIDINTGPYIEPELIAFLKEATGGLAWRASVRANHYYSVFDTREAALKAAAHVSDRLRQCRLGKQVIKQVIVRVIMDEKTGKPAVNTVITPGQMYTWAMARSKLNLPGIPKVEEKKRDVKKDRKSKISDQQQPPVSTLEEKKRIDTTDSPSGTLSHRGFFGSSSSLSPSIAAPIMDSSGPLGRKDDEKKGELKPIPLQNSGKASVRPPDPQVEEQLLNNAHQDQLAQFTSLDLLNTPTAFLIRQEIVNNASGLGIKPEELNTLRVEQDKDKIGDWLVSCLTVDQVKALKNRFLDKLEQDDREPGQVQENKQQVGEVDNKGCFKYLSMLEDELIKMSAPPETKRNTLG